MTDLLIPLTAAPKLRFSSATLMQQSSSHLEQSTEFDLVSRSPSGQRQQAHQKAFAARVTPEEPLAAHLKQAEHEQLKQDILQREAALTQRQHAQTAQLEEALLRLEREGLEKLRQFVAEQQIERLDFQLEIIKAEHDFIMNQKAQGAQFEEERIALEQERMRLEREIARFRQTKSAGLVEEVMD